MIELVGGVLELGLSGSEEELVSISEWSFDETWEWGEVRNALNPQYASLVEGQSSWTATATIDLYANEIDTGSDGVADDAEFLSSIQTVRQEARNRAEVNCIITYGPKGGNPDYGELDYPILTEQALARISSESYEGTFFADGEVWSLEVELQGEEAFTTV